LYGNVSAHEQRFWLKDVARLNIPSAVVSLDKSHPEISTLNASLPRNMNFIFATLEVSQPEISTLKDLVSKNMPSILVTPVTFQPEISPLKTLATENIDCMLVTADTSQLAKLSPLKSSAP
jgi:hypothetical protein